MKMQKYKKKKRYRSQKHNKICNKLKLKASKVKEVEFGNTKIKIM